jgi:isochorismate hydrolase
MKDVYFTKYNNDEKCNSWMGDLKLHSKEGRSKFCVENSVLLVVDMQNFFIDTNSHAYVPSSPVVVDHIIQLVDIYRRKGRPVVFTYFGVIDDEADPIGRWWNDSVKDGSFESEFRSDLSPQVQEKVVRKNSYSCFYQTDLEDYLREIGTRQVIVSGVLTNLCCEMAGRESFVRGFEVFSVIDAMATYCEDAHLSGLRNMTYGFATPICTRDIVL